MKLEDLNPAQRARFESAWRDPEVTQGDCLKRFKIPLSYGTAITAVLGPKAQLGALSNMVFGDRNRKRLAARRERRARLALELSATGSGLALDDELGGGA